MDWAELMSGKVQWRTSVNPTKPLPVPIKAAKFVDRLSDYHLLNNYDFISQVFRTNF